MYVLPDEQWKQEKEKRKEEKGKHRTKRKVARQFAPRSSILVFHHQSPGLGVM
jgi:hypothetical protein